MEPKQLPEEPSSPPAPQRTLITSRAETQAAVLQTIEAATRSVLCVHSDLSIFDLARADVVSLL